MQTIWERKLRIYFMTVTPFAIRITLAYGLTEEEFNAVAH